MIYLLMFVCIPVSVFSMFDQVWQYAHQKGEAQCSVQDVRVIIISRLNTTER